MAVSQLKRPGFVTMSSPVSGMTYPLYATLFRPGGEATFGADPPHGPFPGDRGRCLEVDLVPEDHYAVGGRLQPGDLFLKASRSPSSAPPPLFGNVCGLTGENPRPRSIRWHWRTQRDTE